jgi:predicted HAD superfamily Cof-like phosphohydrolase
MFSEAQKAVQAFHQKSGLPISSKVSRLDKKRAELRAKWMSEEIHEFLNATDLVDQADAIADLIYYAIGVFIEMGLNGSKVFELVHQANMNKIEDDARPIFDKDGKVMKPNNWVSPRERICDWLRNIGVRTY